MITCKRDKFVVDTSNGYLGEAKKSGIWMEKDWLHKYCKIERLITKLPRNDRKRLQSILYSGFDYIKFKHSRFVYVYLFNLSAYLHLDFTPATNVNLKNVLSTQLTITNDEKTKKKLAKWHVSILDIEYSKFNHLYFLIVFCMKAMDYMVNNYSTKNKKFIKIRDESINKLTSAWRHTADIHNEHFTKNNKLQNPIINKKIFLNTITNKLGVNNESEWRGLLKYVRKLNYINWGISSSTRLRAVEHFHRDIKLVVFDWITDTFVDLICYDNHIYKNVMLHIYRQQISVHKMTTYIIQHKYGNLWIKNTLDHPYSRNISQVANRLNLDTQKLDIDNMYNILHTTIYFLNLLWFKTKKIYPNSVTTVKSTLFMYIFLIFF